MAEYSEQNSVSAETPSPLPAGEAAAPAKGPKISAKEAKTLKQRLMVSQRFCEDVFKRQYERCVKLYKGEHWPIDTMTDEHRVVVNQIIPNVETKVDTIAFSYPEFILKPETKESAPFADVARDAIAYEWRKANVQREAKRALKDKELFSFGVVKVGWRFETEDYDCLQDDRKPVEGEDLDPDVLLEAIEEGRDLEAEMVPKAQVRVDQFSAKRINPMNFLVDPESSWVIEDACYCGYKELRPLEEVRKDSRYANTRKLKGSSKNLDNYLGDEERKKDDAARSSDIKRVCLYHYYEKRRRLHVVFSDEHDEPLLVEKWAWKADRYPFRTIHGIHLEDDFYGIPGPILIEPMQREINETRSQLHTHRRRHNRMYQASKGSLSAQSKKQLRSGVDGTVVEHDGQIGSQVVIPIQNMPIQPEVYQCDKIAQQDMAKVSGLDAYESGLIPTKRLTTTEVESIQGSGSARMKEDQRQFEEFCAEIAEDCLDWLMQWDTRTRSLPIYDQHQNVTDWRDFDAQEINGDFRVTVYVGSTTVKNREAEAKEAAYVLQAMTPFIQMGAVNPTPFLEQFLTQFDWVRDVQAILKPPAPPAPGPDQIGPPTEGGEQIPPELMAAMGGGMEG